VLVNIQRRLITQRHERRLPRRRFITTFMRSFI